MNLKGKIGIRSRAGFFSELKPVNLGDKHNRKKIPISERENKLKLKTGDQNSRLRIKNKENSLQNSRSRTPSNQRLISMFLTAKQ